MQGISELLKHRVVPLTHFVTCHVVSWQGALKVPGGPTAVAQNTHNLDWCTDPHLCHRHSKTNF
jgi:hypothetical protein